MKNILFVCTGNTCRSPMAEGIANKLIANSKTLKSTIIAQSCGISVFQSQKANPNAVYVLNKLWNIDISNHTAKNITQLILRKYMLILTMTDEQSRYLKIYYPEYEKIIYPIKGYISQIQNKYYDSLNIEDPFGMDEKIYEKCAHELYNLIYTLIEYLDLAE